MSIIQNTLYLTTNGTVVSQSQKTLKIVVEDETTTIPIHNISSICVFGYIRITPNVLNLCLKHQVSVHYHTPNGYLLGQVIGSGDSRYLIRRAQYAKADDAREAREIASIFVAGKLQNSRLNLLRSRRDTHCEQDKRHLLRAIKALERLLFLLGKEWNAEGLTVREALDPVRGIEGMGAKNYFGAFTHMVKQQREDFAFVRRSRRPAHDRINCLLSFLYGLLRNDCLTALSVAGIDPYVGWLHATRAGRPACALDLMEEFRPLVERLALTLVNRGQIQPNHFKDLEGGSVELKATGRKVVISAWKKRKETKIKHDLYQEKIFLGHVFWVQARLLSRWLRGEVPHYIPFIFK